MKKLLKEMKTYIEIMEVDSDAAFGFSRSLKKLIEEGAMPELYNKVCKYITKN